MPFPPSRIRSLRALGLACVAAVAGGIAAGPASAQSASCPGADLPFASLTRAQAEVSVVCLSNAARSAVGIGLLRTNDQLRTAARRHADDMQARGFFDHVAPAPAPHGPTLLDRLQSAGYPLRTAGENLASGQSTPRRVTTAWLESPGHCRNLLDGVFDEVGVGRATASPIWVQALGTRKDTASESDYAGCDTGNPPSIASVASGPPSDRDDAGSPGPDTKSAGVRISRVSRSSSRWTLRVRGGKAVGRTATVRTYRAVRKCVREPGRRERCSNVPGSRRSTVKVKLRSTTTVRIKRRAGDAFVRVTHGAFRRGDTRYAAGEVTRRLPR